MADLDLPEAGGDLLKKIRPYTPVLLAAGVVGFILWRAAAKKPTTPLSQEQQRELSQEQLLYEGALQGEGNAYAVFGRVMEDYTTQTEKGVEQIAKVMFDSLKAMATAIDIRLDANETGNKRAWLISLGIQSAASCIGVAGNSSLECDRTKAGFDGLPWLADNTGNKVLQQVRTLYRSAEKADGTFDLEKVGEIIARERGWIP